MQWFDICLLLCKLAYLVSLSHAARQSEQLRQGFRGETSNMTLIVSSFELHLKSKFNTTSTVAVLALSVVLLVAWKYRKSFKQYIKHGKFKILPQMWGSKRVPVENEDNFSKVLFHF